MHFNNSLKPYLITTLSLALSVSPFSSLESALAQDQIASRPQVQSSQSQTSSPAPIAHDHSENFYTKSYSKDNLAALQSELKNHPTSQGYVRLSDLFFELKELENAGQAAQVAIKINPKNVDAYLNLSTSFSKRGAYQDAYKTARYAFELNPNDASINFNLGVIAYKMGNSAQAVIHLQTALSIDPNHKKARESLDAISQVTANP